MRASTQRNARPGAGGQDAEDDEWRSRNSSMHTSIASGEYQDPGSETLELTERSITKTYSHTGLLAHEQSPG